MSKLGKPFIEKLDRKKNRNVKTPHVKKPLARNGNLVQTRPRTNYEWIGKTI